MLSQTEPKNSKSELDESFVFICDSDLHFQSTVPGGPIVVPRSEKADNVLIITRIKPDFVIMAGDLTNNGSDGSTFCYIPISGPEKQLQAYLSQYVQPIQAHVIPIYAAMGNHDNYTYPPYVYMAVKSYLQKFYGGIHYNFVHKNVQFICLGLYPDAAALKYFNTVANKSLPIVVFFHYNLVGDWSNWWSDQEKDDFLITITGYQIKLIVTGHIHICASYQWNNYPVITCGGQGLYQCTYSAETQSINVVCLTN